MHIYAINKSHVLAHMIEEMHEKINKDLLCLVMQGTKIFQYCTCPAGRVTYKFNSSCKHMFCALKEYAIKSIRE